MVKCSKCGTEYKVACHICYDKQFGYTSIFRTKRHYNFQKDFATIKEFEDEAEKGKNEIVWAILISCRDGDTIKKISGDYA